MEFNGIKEKTLVLVKPDGVQRGLVGETISRLERKGLKLIGLKMMRPGADLWKEHYAHIADKPFYPEYEAFMMASPVAAMVWEGKRAVDIVIELSGVTDAGKAASGTVRGDYGMGMANIMHRSDSVETAKAEVARFFSKDELFDYDKTDYANVYLADETAS